MRTGAIFARGSCRALKWMALVGMVFALGVGSTVAQTLSLSGTAEGTSPEATVTLATAIADDGTPIVFTLSIEEYDGDVPVLTGRNAAPGGTLVNDVGVTLDNTTLTVAAGERTGKVVPALIFADDDDAEDEYFTLRATGDDNPQTVINLNVIVDDSDAQEYTLTLPTAAGGAITEGADAETLTLEADPARSVDILVELALDAGDPTKYTLGDVMTSAITPGATDMFGTTGDNNPVTATIEAMADGNRTPDMITVTAYTGTVAAPEAIASLVINVKDANPLPMVEAMVVDEDGMDLASQPDSIDEGETVMVKLTVVDEDGDATAAVEDLSVMLMQMGTAGVADYRLGMNPIAIAEGEMSSDMFELEARPDGDLDPGETLMFNAVVSGDSEIGPGTETSFDVLSLEIDDRTPLTVTPKSQTDIDNAYIAARDLVDDAQNMWMPGGSPLTIALAKLFNLPTTGDYDADASSDDPTIVTADADAGATGGGMVTVTPVGEGMTNVHVTVSADGASATIQLSATRARATFKAMVDGIPVTAKTQEEIDAAYMAARDAAAGADGYWTTEGGPATIALSDLFNDLPADATPTVMSSMTDYVLASTTGSDIVLNPEGVGTSTITVTVAGVPASFMATVDAMRLDTRGRITAITIDSAEEKTINNVKRMHVQEGDLTTLSITMEWTNQQITYLWAGYTTANPPPPAKVVVEERGWSDGDSWQWLSFIETREDPGPYGAGGQDVVLATNVVEVPIPTKPRTDTQSVFVTGSRTGSTSLSLPHDVDAEEEGFRIRVDPDGQHYLVNLETSKIITDQIHVIEDDEVQGIKIVRAKASPGTVYEGGPDVLFDITADPRREDLDLSVRYDLTDLEGVSVASRSYSLQSSLGWIPIGNEPDDKDIARINLDPNDGNREDIDLQLHAEVVSYGLDTGAFDDIQSQKVEFTVVDVHKLPHLTVTPTAATVMEGGEIELTLTVDRNPPVTIAIAGEVRQHTHEALSIAVEAGGALNDFTVAVPAHNKRSPWTQSVKHKVKVPDNDDVDVVDGETMAMLNFVVNGTESTNGPRPDSDPKSTALVELTIQDATTTLVSVKDGAYDAIQMALGEPPTLVTGMSGGLMGGDLFEYDPSAVSVTYGTSVEGGAVTASASDDGMVTIMAVMAGEAKVSITATATANTSSLMIDQTEPSVAMLTFPVMVEDAPLDPLVFTVSAEDGAMDLVEGGAGIKVTVMTNRAVTENTEVMLVRDGGSSATDDDYELFPPMVTILADDMSGSVMVTALEDDMMENEGNMQEMLTLFLVVDGMQMTDKSVSFYLWDDAVPALPVIAQLLLAALLGLGGYRRYLRRR